MISSNKKQGMLSITSGGRLLREGEVSSIQRVRILSAMVGVASELGYANAVVAPVVTRAGVSRRTFYELFDSREDCFLGAFEWGVQQAREVVMRACRDQRSWREQVRRGLAALLSFLDAEIQLARVLVIEASGAGRLVLARRSEVLRELISALDAEAPRARNALPSSALTAEGVVGGVFSVIHERLLEQRMAHECRWSVSGPSVPIPNADDGELRRPGSLIELHSRLMALIVLPYLGARAAGEEIARPLPPDLLAEHDDAVAEKSRHVLERLHIRLTYRTVRCLLFIGDNPGASNREIARGAEISDEGQASKLLWRLKKLDLIANSRPAGPGQPNRWTLTPQGEQVLSVVPNALSVR